MPPAQQDEFYDAVMVPGIADSELSLTFSFKGSRIGSTTRKSAVLSLTPHQHDAMYALSGCSDVRCVNKRHVVCTPVCEP